MSQPTDDLRASTAMPWISVCQTAPPQRGLSPSLGQGLLEAAWGLGRFLTDEELEKEHDRRPEA